MLEIFIGCGCVLVGILLLCLWADVRDLKREMKTWRRDFMRNCVGGRTSEGYEGFSEAEYWREAREKAPDEYAGETVLQAEAQAEPGGQKKVVTLKPGEEQVLREILVEFLS